MSHNVNEPTARFRAVWQPTQLTWLIVALLVLLVAAASRLVALLDIPPGLAQDEVLDADIALFIRQGEHALFFRHGYGHEPLFHYLAVPLQILIGDNALAIRLLPAFLGLLLVAAVMRWAHRDYGALAALVSGIGLAISWWPIIFSRIGIRPILEPVLLVGMIWFWPLSEGVIRRHSLKKALLAGIFLGLSVYSYTAARSMLILPAAYLVYLGVRYIPENRRHSVMPNEDKHLHRATLNAQAIYALVILMVSALMYLPLAITLRANPELEQRIEQLGGPLNALGEGDVGPILESTVATAGVFSFSGDPRWTYSLPDRPLFDPATAILFYGGLLLTVLYWRRPTFAVLPIWLLLAFLPSALSPDAPSTVRMVGAMPIVYLMPGLALAAILSSIKRGQSTPAWSSTPARSIIMIGIIGLILAFNLYRTIRDGFIEWPNNPETHLRYQTIFQDMARHWRDNHAEDDQPAIFVESFFELIDDATVQRNAGEPVNARWIQTGAGVGGAMVWPAEAADIEPIRIYVPEYAPLPAELARAIGVAADPVYRSSEELSFAVYELPLHAFEPSPQQDRPTRFHSATGELLLSLRGFEWLDNPGKSAIDSSNIRIGTWWNIDAYLPDDVALFLHLVNEEGQIVAQSDGFDVAAGFLKPGDQVFQRHVISLVEPLRPGQYRVLAGVYQRGSGDRLAVSGTSNDALELFRCGVVDEPGKQPGISCDLRVDG